MDWRTARGARDPIHLGVGARMSTVLPHYLLRLETAASERSLAAGHWRFVLENLDGPERTDVSDDEPGVLGERLQLLGMVRALESLDQPSRVTLTTASRYLERGLTDGLDTWRRCGWHWERFGEMRPIRDHDLWQRVDRALMYHRVRCRAWPPTSDAAQQPAWDALPDLRSDAIAIGSGRERQPMRWLERALVASAAYLWHPVVWAVRSILAAGRWGADLVGRAPWLSTTGQGRPAWN
jgi:ribonuclease HI